MHFCSYKTQILHTWVGKISIVIINGTIETPNDRKKMVKMTPQTGIQLVIGSSVLKKWWIDKMVMPHAPPPLERISKLRRPNRSMRNILKLLAQNWTIAIAIDDWMGVKNEPILSKIDVELYAKIPNPE